jgi:hypothetical protein
LIGLCPPSPFQLVGEKQRLVIVNLQDTPLGHLAALRVYAKCDDFSTLLMQKLGLEIPKFELKRCIPSDSDVPVMMLFIVIGGSSLRQLCHPVAVRYKQPSLPLSP